MRIRITILCLVLALPALAQHKSNINTIESSRKDLNFSVYYHPSHYYQNILYEEEYIFIFSDSTYVWKYCNEHTVGGRWRKDADTLMLYQTFDDSKKQEGENPSLKKFIVAKKADAIVYFEDKNPTQPPWAYLRFESFPQINKRKVNKDREKVLMLEDEVIEMIYDKKF